MFAAQKSKDLPAMLANPWAENIMQVMLMTMRMTKITNMNRDGDEDDDNDGHETDTARG